MITKPTSQSSDNNDDDGNNNDSSNIAFIALFAVSFVINILLTTVVTCSKVKAKKKSYSPNDA